MDNNENKKPTAAAYVTFRVNSLIYDTKKYAIPCKDRHDAMQLCYDLNSLASLRYVRINTTGTFAKGTEIVNSIAEVFG